MVQMVQAVQLVEQDQSVVEQVLGQLPAVNLLDLAMP